MATSSKSGIPFARFVERLIEDPAQVPQTLLFTGYAGKSPLDNHIRLYLDAQLRTYQDIHKDAILHFEVVPPEYNPLTPVYVWIKQAPASNQNPVGKPAEEQMAGQKRLRFFEGALHDNFAAGKVPTVSQNCTQYPQQCANTAWLGCPQAHAGHQAGDMAAHAGAQTAGGHCTADPQFCATASFNCPA